MASFEMLYGRRCQTPLFWSETGERKIFGPNILQEAEKHVRMVRENLWIAQSGQKSYVDHGRRKLSFKVGDFMYLKVSPMRGLHHFKERGKLVPRFIGLFKIIETRGEVAYQLELLTQLSDVHDVFHVSQLKKCLCVPKEKIPMEDLNALKAKNILTMSINSIRCSIGLSKHQEHDMNALGTFLLKMVLGFVGPTLLLH
jgi:hypothetical protein